MTDPLVTTAWLADHLDDPDVQVVDATWFMPAENKLGADVHAAGHIPGAMFFDIDALSDKATDLPHMLLAPKAFAEAAGALGLRRDATIVVYDASGIFSAPRVWWTLRVMAFPNVFVLDGGLPKWTAEGRALETGAATPEATTLEPMFKPGLVQRLDDVRHIVTARTAQLVDARAAGRFRGEVAEPRAGLKSGHMPGALNVPFGAVLRADGTLKDGEELKAAFAAGGVDIDRPIVTTCGSGVSAAVLALGLARLGREDVPVYDGSWTEWGGLPDTPIATDA